MAKSEKTSWEDKLDALIAQIESGKGRAQAKSELLKMARIADLSVNMLEVLKTVQSWKRDLIGGDILDEVTAMIEKARKVSK